MKLLQNTYNKLIQFVLWITFNCIATAYVCQGSHAATQRGRHPQHTRPLVNQEYGSSVGTGQRHLLPSLPQTRRPLAARTALDKDTGEMSFEDCQYRLMYSVRSGKIERSIATSEMDKGKHFKPNPCATYVCFVTIEEGPNGAKKSCSPTKRTLYHVDDT